ncbi:carboxymuconolactone decarboxylase [soil metagenome]
MRHAVFATLGWLIMTTTALAQDRMPPIPVDQQNPAQKEASAAFLAARRSPVFGPFTPLLRSPELMTSARTMGDYLRYRSSLPPRLSEFAILIVARQWNQPVEWEIHQPIALTNGVPSKVTEELGAGKRPTGMSAEEALVYDFLTELDRDKGVADATYERTKKAFGEQGVIDLTGIAGYYTLLAMTMNVARTPTSSATPAKMADLPKRKP